MHPLAFDLNRKMQVGTYKSTLYTIQFLFLLGMSSCSCTSSVNSFLPMENGRRHTITTTYYHFGSQKNSWCYCSVTFALLWSSNHWDDCTPKEGPTNGTVSSFFSKAIQILILWSRLWLYFFKSRRWTLQFKSGG